MRSFSSKFRTGALWWPNLAPSRRNLGPACPPRRSSDEFRRDLRMILAPFRPVLAPFWPQLSPSSPNLTPKTRQDPQHCHFQVGFRSPSLSISPSFVRSFARSLFRSFVRSFLRPFPRSFAQKGNPRGAKRSTCPSLGWEARG